MLRKTVKKPLSTAKNKKKVYIDTKGAFSKLRRERGIKVTGLSFAEEFGMSSITVTDWNKEAPKAVRVIFEFLEKYDLEFKDLVKKG